MECCGNYLYYLSPSYTCKTWKSFDFCSGSELISLPLQLSFSVSCGRQQTFAIRAETSVISGEACVKFMEIKLDVELIFTMGIKVLVVKIWQNLYIETTTRWYLQLTINATVKTIDITYVFNPILIDFTIDYTESLDASWQYQSQPDNDTPGIHCWASLAFIAWQMWKSLTKFVEIKAADWKTSIHMETWTLLCNKLTSTDHSIYNNSKDYHFLYFICINSSRPSEAYMRQ